MIPQFHPEIRHIYLLVLEPDKRALAGKVKHALSVLSTPTTVLDLFPFSLNFFFNSVFLQHWCSHTQRRDTKGFLPSMENFGQLRPLAWNLKVSWIFRNDIADVFFYFIMSNMFLFSSSRTSAGYIHVNINLMQVLACEECVSFNFRFYFWSLLWDTSSPFPF